MSMRGGRSLAIAASLGLAAAVVGWRLARRVRAAALHRLCEALPKAELHAHLHGCARLTTIAELAPPDVDVSALLIGPKDGRSLETCFGIFAAIHKTVTSLATVRRVAREVLDDFAADNVRYLELRTTPRALSDADINGYVEAVLAELAASETRQPGMMVRLLLSIDRTGSLEAALQTVMLAARLRGDEGSAGAKYVVGVDFSGNPTKGCFSDFLPAFRLARDQCGLRVAVHAGEVPHAADSAAIVDFGADRLGHALLLEEEEWSALAARPVPIELCPTSNLMTLKLPSMDAHPTLHRLVSDGYPISISTDDSSVFGTTPSCELAHAATAARLTATQTAALAAAPFAHAFAPEAAALGVRLEDESRRAVDAHEHAVRWLRWLP